MPFNDFRLVIVCAALTAGCFAGCGDEAATPTTVTVEDLNAKSGVVKVSPDQAMELVGKVRNLIDANDANGLTALLDQEMFFERVFVGLGLGEQSKKGFRKGVDSSGGLRALMNVIVQQTSQGGSYHFVRMVESKDGPQPLFRLSMPESGHNYHRLVLTSTAAGVRIADLHVMLTGELMSGTLRRSAIHLAAYENRSIADRLTGSEADIIKHSDKLQEMSRLAKLGNYDGFMKEHNSLPDSLQKDKNVMLLRMMVSQQNEAEYEKALQALAEEFPNDPATDFREIDRFALKKDFEGVLKSVDRLIENTQDPFLHTLRLEALIALDRHDEAMKACQIVLDAEPDNLMGYWAAIGTALEVKEFVRVGELLTAVENKFDLAFGDLRTVPEYAEFVNSEAYGEWKKSR